MTARRYLEEFGVPIARNGYEVIPIIPGEKRPYGNKWQKYDGSEEGVQDWLNQGKGSYGIGIKARHAPAVDIDVLDLAVVNEIKAEVVRIAGETLERVGLPPKTLLAYRADELFPKVDTGFWLDAQDRTVKVEILADGQQYVAAHIHPDTGKPYSWKDGRSPLRVPLGDLPLLTHGMANEIKEVAMSIFMNRGYKKKTNALTRLSATGYDMDDPFAAVKAKTQISDEELERKLMMVPGSDDYELWTWIGMALYHQYDGNQQGYDLWDQWSQTAPNYDSEALEKHWPSFNIQQKDRPPLTARIILAKAKEVEKEDTKKHQDAVLIGIEESRDIDTLVEVCEKIKAIEFTAPFRELLTGKIKAKWKDITKEMPRIGFVRDLIRYESREMVSMPPWLKHWVYCQQTDTVFHMVDRRDLDRSAFNASYSRFMLTDADRMEGKATPEVQPFDAAANLFQIPVVYNRMFMPGLPTLYSFNGVDYANSYSDKGIPEIPDKLSPVEQQAIDIFLAHFDHIIANERDRRVFLDWLTYVVQNPGEKINWAILLQGAEGDGKSYFLSILKAVIGDDNAKMIPGKALEEKYNPWAEGGMICFIEDVRLHGNNRFDAVNTLKPMITNPMASIRRMQTNVYEVVNTMNYIATSNLKDALPVGEEDSRFFPIFTRFQSSAAIDAFKLANPDYYRRLFGTISFGGAIRKFLLERQISEDFDAKDRAPKSSYRKEMIEMNRGEEEQALHDALEDSTDPAFSELLLDSALIHDNFMELQCLPPRGKALKRLLDHQGFTFLARIRLGNGERRQFWSKRPDIWAQDEDERKAQILDYLDPNGL